MRKKNSAIVIGVGAEQGIGAALCRKFAANGYHVYVVGRTPSKIEHIACTINNSGGSAQPLVVDASNEEDVIRLFDRVFSSSDEAMPPDLVVFNAGNNQKINFNETSVKSFEEFWRVGCLAGFIVGRESARHLIPLGRGTIIFTGASASMRGKPGFAHFAAAKAGLRMISQSMAREFGPAGLHVAHVVLDGGVYGERLRSRFPTYFSEKGQAGLLDTEAIAETYWFIHRQPANAWTQEIDLRPSIETF